MNLDNIKDPSFMNDMNETELNALCEDIRKFLITNLSKTGGHIGPNLGVVELTVALHKVFNSPQDKFIFDVGHQSYVHKILTGRASKFNTLRQYKGLSGFIKRQESEHDIWEAGHSSTSLSAALGIATARDLNNDDYNVVTIIGDGSLTGGMAFEALNHIGHEQKKVIVVLNDNKMSISPNVGALHQYLDKLRSSRRYRITKNVIKRSKEIPLVGEHIYDFLNYSKESIKFTLFNKGRLFEALGFDYYGPIDGHDLGELIRFFEFSKKANGPVLLHVLTQKGKGYKFAEDDKMGSWHGTPPFDIETGKTLSSLKENEESWSNIIARAVEDCAAIDKNIVTITPAMQVGSKLTHFEKKYPNRFFDVGIAEEHAATFAAALALSGKKPFLPIYSTFLQRAYDQVSHDIARQNLNVLIGVDRAGLVGEDGETHHGVYDISYLGHIPNMQIVMPKDAKQAQNLVYTAFNTPGPTAIRYPRGNALYQPVDEYKTVEVGKWEILKEGTDAIIISYGPDILKIVDIANNINDINIMVVNALFIKPVDEQMLEVIYQMNKPIITYENVTEIGCLGTTILQHANRKNYKPTLKIMALPDKFIQHGTTNQLLEDVNLTLDDLFNNIKELV